MLKVPDHQVAGHQAGGGKLGPLVDDSGHFYKPLQSDERGSHEVAFYTAFSTDTRIPDQFRKFFPVFHGTKLLEASDGSGLYPHLALEDIVSGRTNPCILDAKIGARTWYPQAAEDYLQKCLKKDRETACLELGFRISGLQVYGNKLTGLWKPDRHVIQSSSVEDSKLALRKFISSNPSTDSDIKPDCSFASTVYGGPDGILAQLLVLKSWFEEQTFYHFYSCSVLMVYDKESILQGENRGAQIKLVDFAHVIDGRGVIDHNFLGGLCSLIKMITDIVTSSST
ncbi:inositol polyphosphate multikinase beta-like [Pyrus ussuriensis x Pyrus communis]|uniref:Inositol polyphosphate multikinase n=1 Tax=Pyrus ussuriensis x Pyrus communis TaxID=2448454 RepID=A0A5N5G0A5_9ROSA|nr:inositol polyphosphate multikinase beta [Pyrus x bretschneideri]KAB2608796.1 inositol polyphosphate multikinase beta-like [Pyrus ussuriensis x Pyrus communis]